MELLESEAYDMMRPREWAEKEPEYSFPIFYSVHTQWQDWQRGVPPSTGWSGRGAQNPRLLRAFAVLDRVKGQIAANMRERHAQELQRLRWELNASRR